MALPVGSMDEQSAATILEQVHGQAMRVPVKDAAEGLQRLLTGRIAAYVVNVKDAKTVARWAGDAVAEIRPESEQRLRVAYEIMALLLRFEGPSTTRLVPGHESPSGRRRARRCPPRGASAGGPRRRQEFRRVQRQLRLSAARCFGYHQSLQRVTARPHVKTM